MPTIQLKTQVPGPKSKALAERRASAVPRGLSHATPIYVARSEGAVLEDVDGNRYIDLAGGIGCLNVGHRSPGVLSAIREQLDKFLHTCVQVTAYESYVRLAERLNELTPGNFPKKTMIADEVMAGFGRTGEWFAIDHWKVVPDLISMAKGLTSSYLPLGAVGM